MTADNIEFPEGAHWFGYGVDARSISEAGSLAFRLGDDTRDLTGVIKETHGFIALSLETGGVLCFVDDFTEAMRTAEQEALHSTHP